LDSEGRRISNQRKLKFEEDSALKEAREAELEAQAELLEMQQYLDEQREADEADELGDEMGDELGESDGGENEVSRNDLSRNDLSQNDLSQISDKENQSPIKLQKLSNIVTESTKTDTGGETQEENENVRTESRNLRPRADTGGEIQEELQNLRSESPVNKKSKFFEKIEEGGEKVVEGMHEMSKSPSKKKASGEQAGSLMEGQHKGNKQGRLSGPLTHNLSDSVSPNEKGEFCPVVTSKFNLNQSGEAVEAVDVNQSGEAVEAGDVKNENVQTHVQSQERTQKDSDGGVEGKEAMKEQSEEEVPHPEEILADAQDDVSPEKVPTEESEVQVAEEAAEKSTEQLPEKATAQPTEGVTDTEKASTTTVTSPEKKAEASQEGGEDWQEGDWDENWEAGEWEANNEWNEDNEGNENGDNGGDVAEGGDNVGADSERFDFGDAGAAQGEKFDFGNAESELEMREQRAILAGKKRQMKDELVRNTGSKFGSGAGGKDANQNNINGNESASNLPARGNKIRINGDDAEDVDDNEEAEANSNKKRSSEILMSGMLAKEFKTRSLSGQYESQKRSRAASGCSSRAGTGCSSLATSQHNSVSQSVRIVNRRDSVKSPSVADRVKMWNSNEKEHKENQVPGGGLPSNRNSIKVMGSPLNGSPLNADGSDTAKLGDKLNQEMGDVNDNAGTQSTYASEGITSSGESREETDIETPINKNNVETDDAKTVTTVTDSISSNTLTNHSSNQRLAVPADSKSSTTSFPLSPEKPRWMLEKQAQEEKERVEYEKYLEELEVF
jgi:hypothetical protein